MAKRISLREFQEGLVQRLTSAARGERSRALLGILAGRDYWLLNLSDAGEIVPLPPLTTVPLTKPWFAGIANIRGTLYSVVDFSAFQGGEPTAQGGDARLLLIGARHGLNMALLVSRALGLKNPDNLIHEPAIGADADDTAGSAGDGAPAWVGERYTDKPDAAAPSAAPPAPISWRVLQVRPLLDNPDFLDISDNGDIGQ